ncbi:conserved exported protein of unknown function [Rhodovastum atsumiense]|uniref:DUF3300 domain-containing protein n=1 Tax=Rhodovastum atsumiense TaxID=504468 RepID=A0A5M6J2C9_9PROT|nr:hypothetical protein [Rhodovastum atsumiense]KAA5614681.1 hypothetical protein F1189_00710 [Rhodovastum atsumiense]CAH2599787.1 conserved exported protein of unknown function [Rhodovastum atsumiense]
MVTRPIIAALLGALAVLAVAATPGTAQAQRYQWREPPRHHHWHRPPPPPPPHWRSQHWRPPAHPYAQVPPSRPPYPMR